MKTRNIIILLLFLAIIISCRSSTRTDANISDTTRIYQTAPPVNTQADTMRLIKPDTVRVPHTDTMRNPH